jgi:protein-L-isoaspartate(D-aspartate) O-methyltransferase
VRELRAEDLRRRMVSVQIEARGVDDPLVLEAMREVPREMFLPGGFSLETAYGDYPLSIGFGQTISQPYIVAFMIWKLGLRPGDRVLEIGTGSGYQTAILDRMGLDVVTVEVIPGLALDARRAVGECNPGSGARFLVADGYHGWPAGAPYDGIIVSACPPELPSGLVDQLTDRGCIVTPVGDFSQYLVRVTRDDDGLPLVKVLLGVRFVPLVDTSARRRPNDI